MKKLIKFILFFVLVLIVAPLFSVFYYSLSNTEVSIFEWYIEIFQNRDFLSAFWLSVRFSFLVSLLATTIGFFISLAWFNNRQRNSVIVLTIILGLMPPDIISLGISKLSQLLNIQNSNLFFTIIGLILYVLPFIIMLLWSRYYFIDNVVIMSARDIGMKNTYIILRVILGLSFQVIFSSFLLSFILAINEYSRTYYLSGYHNFLSEYLYGKLKSGTDESTYAGSSVIIIITCILLIIALIIMRSKTVRNIK